MSELGDPAVYPHRWQDFICNFPWAWKKHVRKWIEIASPLDRASVKGGGSRDVPEDFRCVDCCLSLEYARALAQHQRKVHARRSDVKRWAPENGKCCVCGTTFSARLLLVAHLTDGRVRHGRPPLAEGRSADFAPFPHKRWTGWTDKTPTRGSRPGELDGPSP